MSLNLQPVWIEELLVIWASAEITRAPRLARDGVCPMFRMLGRVEDDGGPELQALQEGLVELQALSPDGWLAVHQAFRPWGHGLPAAGDAHMLALRDAAAWLARWVDRQVGE